MFRKLLESGDGSISITVDGETVRAEQGESVAAALLRQPEVWTRLNPVSLTRRAPYCMMGVCFECVAEIDGVAGVQTCLRPVCDGMRIVRQLGRPRIGS